jgi:hypothetical protein
MRDTPEGYVVHRTSARLRVAVPAKRRDRAFFAAAEEELHGHPGVKHVETNPATASILIHSADSGALLEMLRLQAPFTIVEEAPKGQMLALAPVRQQHWGWDRQIQKWTGGRSNPARAVVFLVVVAGVAFQVARGKRLSAAATVLLYSGRMLQRWWVGEAAEPSAGADQSALAES